MLLTNRADRADGRYLPLGLLVVLLALALRVYRLDDESLWLDEGFSIRVALMPFREMFVTVMYDQHPPLHFLVLREWMAAFGDSAVSARFPSVLANTAATFYLFLIGRDLFSARIGLIAALFFAVSSHNIWYAQDARMYALLSLTGIASIYHCLRALETGTALDIGLYILSTVLCFYTQLYSIFTMAFHSFMFLLYLLYNKEETKLGVGKWIMIQLAIAALCLPWVLVVLKLQLPQYFGRHARQPGLYDLARSFVNFSDTPYKAPLYLALGAIACFVGAGGRPAPAGAGEPVAPAWRRVPAGLADYRVVLVLGWIASTTLVPFALSHTVFSIYQLRAQIVSTAGLYLLAALGVMAFGHRLWRIGAVGAVLVASAFAIRHDYEVVHKIPWNRIAALVESRARPGDLVLVNPGLELDNIYAYYGKRTDLRKLPFPADDLSMKGERALYPADTDALLKTVQDADTVWLICRCLPDSQAERILDRPLRAHFQSREVFEFEVGEQVIRYSGRPPS